MDDDEKTKILIEAGSEIVGAAVGGALGFLAAGPVGSAGAGIAGVMIAKSANKLLGDIATRQMSKREEERVGATAAVALKNIKDRLDRGEKPRDDDFFEEEIESRSAAEEVFEGTLRKAQDEHEEKKIKLLGNFFANVAFSSGVSLGEANYYLTLIDNLTYRQICVLGLLLARTSISTLPKLRESDYRKNVSNLSFESVSLLQEIMSLYNSGLVACRQEGGEGFIALLGLHDIAPNGLVLTPLGERVSVLLGADTVEGVDLDKIIMLLHDRSDILKVLGSG
jgi:hypothetical protein